MSFEAEKNLIGGMVWSPDDIQHVCSMLCEKDFEDATLGRIFGVIKEACFGSGLDSSYITQHLRDNLGMREAAIVKEIVEETTSANNVKAWADIVREQSVQRQLMKCATMMANAEDFAKYFEELAMEIRTSDLTIEWVAEVSVTTSEILNKLYREVQED